MRFALSMPLYIAALFCIYAGIELAPEMKWPASPIEYTAANLLVIGAILKLFGHVILLGGLSSSNR